MSKSVLVADDDLGVREFVSEAMSDFGYRTQSVADGLSAIRRIETLEPLDLLIVDVGLPKVNGRAVVQMAQRLLPTLGIIVITGFGEFMLEKSDFIEKLGKPFSLNELYAKVQLIEKQCAGG